MSRMTARISASGHDDTQQSDGFRKGSTHPTSWPLRLFWTAAITNGLWYDDATRDCTECIGAMTMTKNDFRELFQRALNVAADNAEGKTRKPIPRSFLIELHAPGSSERLVSVDEALDHIYLGSDRCYRIIDIAIKEVLPAESVAFVRVSGHPPDEFSKTWDPGGAGPFKQILATRVEDRRVS
jgi:hypothetical protein